MTFTVSDLLLADDVLAELNDALANSGVVAAVDQCIAEAVALVDSYTSAYTIADDRIKGWVRPVALFKAFSITGQGKSPQGYKDAYEAALAELKDVRDGKFPYAPATTVATSSTGAWGSQTRLAMPGDATT